MAYHNSHHGPWTRQTPHQRHGNHPHHQNYAPQVPGVPNPAMYVPKGQGQPFSRQNVQGPDSPYDSFGRDENLAMGEFTTDAQKYEAEENYMRFLEAEAQAQSGDHNALAPDPGVMRTIVKLPRGKYPGSHDFWDNIPAHTATFGWTEANVTPGPTGSLQPVPQVQSKNWYNTYVYVPERRPCLERHYLERYVPGPNGEWVDTVKAERMVGFIDDKIAEHHREEEIREAVKMGYGVQRTHYVDAYDGQPLVKFSGGLWGKNDLDSQYKIDRTDWKDFKNAMQSGFDYGNLRVPWPFGKTNRNKRVMTHTYEWFDRANPHIETDRDYEVMELESAYVDKHMYSKWRARGGDAPTDYATDLLSYATSIDGPATY